MATGPDPDEVLHSTTGKANFQRVTRLLISGGTVLLREIFDLICPPSDLPKILNNPATKKQLKSAKLTKPQWDCLYPSPGLYGESTYFDVTLLFRLLRTICNLIPPSMGWDALPTSTDHTLASDLARIKYYRNSVYGHVNQNMEITDDEFPRLWQDISEALVRIAGQISPTKKQEWQEAIDNFLKDPLTTEDERNAEELLRWYGNDMEVKKSLEELKTSTQKGMQRLEKGFQGGFEGTAHIIEENGQLVEKAVREEAQDIKDQLGDELKNSTQEVQCLKKELQADAQDIKEQLDRVNQSVDRLSASAGIIQIRIKSSDPVLALQERESGLHETASQAEATGGFGTVSINLTSQDVLNLAAVKYLQASNPAKPEDLNGLVYYLEKIKKVLILDTKPGSLIITVKCSSLEILDGLWDDYCAGVLNEMAQNFLITEDLLKELGLIEVKLTTTILEEEYRACREYFLQNPGLFPDLIIDTV